MERRTAEVLLRLLEAAASRDRDLELLELYNELKPELEKRCRRGAKKANDATIHEG